MRLRSGKNACSNGLRIDKEKLEKHVATLIREQLTPEHVEAAIRLAIDKLRERRRKKPDEASRLKQELKKLDGQLNNLITAIEAGEGRATSLTARVAQKEAEIEQKRELLANLETAEVVSFDGPKLRRELSKNLDEWHRLLDTKNAPVLREALAQLLDAKMVLVPHEDGRTWHVEGRTKIGPLVDGPCARSWCRGNDSNSHLIA